uniref:Uncharacterized protein n=1 Tax=Oryza punctata TaxID=4537 RepID=A0A0E0MEG2_ORYPU
MVGDQQAFLQICQNTLSRILHAAMREVTNNCSQEDSLGGGSWPCSGCPYKGWPKGISAGARGDLGPPMWRLSRRWHMEFIVTMDLLNVPVVIDGSCNPVEQFMASKHLNVVEVKYSKSAVLRRVLRILNTYGTLQEI